MNVLSIIKTLTEINSKQSSRILIEASVKRYKSFTNSIGSLNCEKMLSVNITFFDFDLFHNIQFR